MNSIFGEIPVCARFGPVKGSLLDHRLGLDYSAVYIKVKLFITEQGQKVNAIALSTGNFVFMEHLDPVEMGHPASHITLR